VPTFSTLAFKDITLSALIPVGARFETSATQIVTLEGGGAFGASATGVFFNGTTRNLPIGRAGWEFSIFGCYANAPGNTLPTGTVNTDPGCSFGNFTNFASSTSGAGFRDTYAGTVYQIRVSAFDDAVDSFADLTTAGSSLRLAYAVPEPATWAMMLVGFGMMGTSLRNRRRSTKVVFG
jgi:hypothetical protein